MNNPEDMGYIVIIIGLGLILVLFGLRLLLKAIILSFGQKYKVKGKIIDSIKNAKYSSSNSLRAVSVNYFPVYELHHPETNEVIKYEGTKLSKSKHEIGIEKELSVILFRDRIDIRDSRIFTAILLPVLVLIVGFALLYGGVNLLF